MVGHKKQYMFLVCQFHNACPEKGACGKIKGPPRFGFQILRKADLSVILRFIAQINNWNL
jgi:hypothetical protein